MSVVGNSIFADLGIDTEDFQTDALEFTKRVFLKGQELIRKLEAPNTSYFGNREDDFRKFAKAPENKKELVLEAEQAYKSIMGVIDDMSPAALVHLKELIKVDLMRDLDDRIRTAAFENFEPVNAGATLAEEEILPKKIVHKQYVELRKIFKSYTEYAKMFDLYPTDYTIPSLPVKTGNYDNSNGSTKTKFVDNWTYEQTKDDGSVDTFYSIFRFADRIGIKIRNRMDLHEYIDSHPEIGVRYYVAKD